MVADALFIFCAFAFDSLLVLNSAPLLFFLLDAVLFFLLLAPISTFADVLSIFLLLSFSISLVLVVFLVLFVFLILLFFFLGFGLVLLALVSGFLKLLADVLATLSSGRCGGTLAAVDIALAFLNLGLLGTFAATTELTAGLVGSDTFGVNPISFSVRVGRDDCTIVAVVVHPGLVHAIGPSGCNGICSRCGSIGSDRCRRRSGLDNWICSWCRGIATDRSGSRCGLNRICSRCRGVAADRSGCRSGCGSRRSRSRSGRPISSSTSRRSSSRYWVSPAHHRMELPVVYLTVGIEIVLSDHRLQLIIGPWPTHLSHHRT